MHPHCWHDAHPETSAQTMKEEVLKNNTQRLADFTLHRNCINSAEICKRIPLKEKSSTNLKAFEYLFRLFVLFGSFSLASSFSFEPNYTFYLAQQQKAFNSVNWFGKYTEKAK